MAPDPFQRLCDFFSEIDKVFFEEFAERLEKRIEKLFKDYYVKMINMPRRSKNKSLNKDRRKYSLVAKAKRKEMRNIHTSKSYNKQNHYKRDYLKRMHFH